MVSTRSGVKTYRSPERQELQAGEAPGSLGDANRIPAHDDAGVDASVDADAVTGPNQQCSRSSEEESEQKHELDEPLLSGDSSEESEQEHDSDASLPSGGDLGDVSGDGQLAEPNEDLLEPAENISQPLNVRGAELLEGTVDCGDVLLPEFAERAASIPEAFMDRTVPLTSACRSLMKRLYDEQTDFDAGIAAAPSTKRRKRARVRAPLGPLPGVDVGPLFEVDQIWEEIKLRNRPLERFLEKAVEKSVVEKEVRERKAKEKEATGSLEPNTDGPEEANPTESQGEAETGLGKEENPHSKLQGDEPDDSESDTDVNDEELPSTVPLAKKVRFSLSASELRSEGRDEESVGSESDSEKVRNTTAAPDVGIEDGFFNIADMEAFADEAEELALDGRLMAASDDEQTHTGLGNEGSDESEGEDEGEKSLGGRLNGTAARSEERVRYDDFFDRPVGEQDGNGDEAARALRRATMFDDGDSASGEEDERTPLEMSRAKLKQNMIALEDANVTKKPWQLRGEVDAHGRPLNSLLESEFEHDIVAKPKSAPSAEAAASVEDIIRQRVFDNLYDDVVRKLPADYEKEKTKRKNEGPPEISQQRPEEGLAELYEREYAEEREKVSKAAEAASGITQRDEDPEDTPEQAEVNKLFKRLSNKLDALASLHFTPAPPKLPVEMEVKPNVPALNAEEAIPEAVSDAALLAPREVHSARDSDLQGELELNKEERRTRRLTKKRKVAGENKKKIAAERLKEMSDPALAASRRAERTLQRPGKLLQSVKNPSEKKGRGTGKLDGRSSSSLGAFSKSQQFFAELQDTVETDLAGKKASFGSHEAATGVRSSTKLKL